MTPTIDGQRERKPADRFRATRPDRLA